MILDSVADLLYASAVLCKLSIKSNKGLFQVFVAAMARPDKKRRQSLLRRMLNSLVGVPNESYPFGPLICTALTDTGLVPSEGGLAVDSFRTSVTTRLEQVLYASSIIMAGQATD